jgi:hypothetical protein
MTERRDQRGVRHRGTTCNSGTTGASGLRLSRLREDRRQTFGRI